MPGLIVYIYSLLSAVCMALAWWFPGTTGCALGGWASALLLARVLRQPGPRLLPLYTGGALLYAAGFYWLVGAIRDFGGFPLIAALAIFALFVALSSVQFIIFGLAYRYCPRRLALYGLAFPCAWLVAEFVSPRIFPWQPGHTQLSLIPLAQIADLGGAPLISFLMLWAAEAVIELNEQRSIKLKHAAPVLCLGAALLYGFGRIEKYGAEFANRQEVALIQANISTEDKHNQKLFVVNTERYLTLTSSVARPGLLAIWPEAVIQEWIPATVGSVDRDSRLPDFRASGTALMVGALSFDSREKFYNSAMAIYPDGTIPYPYHKRILMPFGEYTPLGDVLPWLREIHPTPEFTPGQDVRVFGLSRPDGNQLRLAPLICYEDIVPSLSRDSVLQGAEVLVNLTNDAWFGHSAAPLQHHLIASFRAIENRRFLLRSTNSGLTAVVDPVGRTVAQLPVFSDGVLEASIAPLNDVTFYTKWIGERPLWLLLVGYALLLVVEKLKPNPLK